MNREEVRQIIDQIADGVWDTHESNLGGFTQCHFCKVGQHAPTSEHAEWCPVRMSREILENSSYMY